MNPPDELAAGAGGSATGSGEKSGDDANGAGAGPGVAAGTGAGGDWGVAAAGGAGFPINWASRSSSSFAEGVEAVPKMPVALDGAPPEGSSDWGEKCLPKRSLNASIRGPPSVRKIALFRNPRLHRLGLTVKSTQPTMQAHSMAARYGQVIAALMIPFACAPGCEPVTSHYSQTI